MTSCTAVDLSFDELLDRARALAVTGDRHILGITGPPGAGKSTVAAQIVEQLGPQTAVLVPMDGFHLANVVLDALGRHDRKGAQDTFDGAGYVNLLQRLHRSALAPGQPGSIETVYAPEFRREMEEPIGSALPVRPDVPLVVTEGNYLLLEDIPWSRARALIDEVWFLAPDGDTRLRRLVLRHQAFGKTPEAALAWALGTDQNNANLIQSTATRADLIIRLQ